VAVILPEAVRLSVVSGVPVVSVLPLGRPSSETLALALVTVGASLTACTLMTLVATLLLLLPSVTVTLTWRSASDGLSEVELNVMLRNAV
jgi:hypothetical protein